MSSTVTLDPEPDGSETQVQIQAPDDSGGDLIESSSPHVLSSPPKASLEPEDIMEGRGVINLPEAQNRTTTETPPPPYGTVREHESSANEGVGDTQCHVSSSEVPLELGITRRSPAARLRIIQQCRKKTLSQESPVWADRLGLEMTELLDNFAKLDCVMVTDELVEYLSNRLKTHGKARSENTGETTAFNTNDPREICRALQGIIGTSTDAKIRRAYTEILLVQSIDDRVLKNKRSSITIHGGPPAHVADHLWHLHSMAYDIAGPVTTNKKDKKFRELRSEYVAGKKWLQITDWFGNKSVIFVFLLAGTNLTQIPHLSVPC